MLITILRINLLASVLIIFIISIRTVTINRLPSYTFTALWEIVFLRLIVPFSIPITIINPSSDAATQVISNNLAENNNSFYFNSKVYTDLTTTLSNNSFDGIKLSCTIWLSVTCFLLITYLIPYFSSCLKFREALPYKNNFVKTWLENNKIRRNVEILFSDKIVSPITLGCINPRIILPKSIINLNDCQINYILMHELLHIKRFDSAKKFIATIITCIYWFNPLVWIINALFARDLEISCDKTLLSQNKEDIRSIYASLLVAFADSHSKLTHNFVAFGYKPINERIVAIMKFKKNSRVSLLIAVMLIVCSTTVFASSKPQSEYASKSPPSFAPVGTSESAIKIIGDVTEEKSTIDLPVKTKDVDRIDENCINFGTKNNQDVFAANNGEVVFAEFYNSSTYGYQVRIKQDDGYLAVYSHLSRDKEHQFAKVGDIVKSGDLIGKTGQTGNTPANIYECSFVLINGDDIHTKNRVSLKELIDYFGF